MNCKMQKLVDKQLNENLKIPNVELIKKLYSWDKEDYYCLKNGFCFQTPKKIMRSGVDLSIFEWEGNEMFISDPNMSCVITKSMMIMQQLANQILNQFTGISFDIFISFDYKDVELPPSSTIRFHKIRENYHIITLEELEEYDQPVGLFQINA